MDATKKLRKLFAAGYQLTPEAYKELISHQNSSDIVNQIIFSKIEKAILSLEDIIDFFGKNESESKPLTTNEDELSDIVIEERISAPKEVEESSSEPLTQINDIKIHETSEQKEKEIFETEKIQEFPRPRKEILTPDLEIIQNPQPTNTPMSAHIFQQYFESRYEQISSMFMKRRDIPNKVSSSVISSRKSKEEMSLIALVNSVQKTKKGNIILKLEDQEGSVTALVSQSKTDLINKADFVLEDSILCFMGTWYNDLLIINDIFWPDVPFNHKPNRAYEEVLSLFISDIHVGSKKFAKELFLKVIKFLNGELESSAFNNVGKSVKYLFVGGDVVDGVGIYPKQEDDLSIESIHLQYLLAAEFFEQIRNDIEIIIIPGNHDGARAAEPQTPISKDFAQELYDLDNVHLLGSPAYVKAHNVEIMMSHGNSILDINAAIPAIPHETSIPAMIEMLKNRHLVPIYGKRTSIAPEPVDQLVISRVPDIFQTGHTHIAGDADYQKVTLINSGTFQYQTSYQKSMNINPTTGITYVVNLESLQRTQLDFKTMN